MHLVRADVASATETLAQDEEARRTGKGYAAHTDPLPGTQKSQFRIA